MIKDLILYHLFGFVVAFCISLIIGLAVGAFNERLGLVFFLGFMGWIMQLMFGKPKNES